MSEHAGADRLRGCAVGALAAALTVAAHGVGGGGYPSSTALTTLIAVCATVGALAGSMRARGPYAVIGMLGLGQIGGHYASMEMIGAGTHHMSSSTVPGWAMIGAHAAATLLCAALIVLANRLYVVASRVVRTVLRADFRPTTGRAALVSAGHDTRPHFGTPQRDAFSRRGPPAFCAP